MAFAGGETAKEGGRRPKQTSCESAENGRIREVEKSAESKLCYIEETRRRGRR